jgi:GGDEF domain-containing protein
MFDSISTETNLAPRAEARRDTQITVFPGRRRFEAAASRVLSRHIGSEDCAMLHIALRGSSGTGSVSLRMLNLVGNALRAGMRSGCVAYLGDAEFAVLLQDTDAREATVYARTMAAVIANFRVLWEGEMLTVSASIGGVVADGCQDGAALLDQAVSASDMAQHKPRCKVHMTHTSDTLLPQAMGLIEGLAAQASAS